MTSSPLRLGLLGVGSHCRNEHLPALRHLLTARPHEATPAAVCDLDRDAAEHVARDLGFQEVYTDLDRMLADARLDGLIAVTPTPLTCELTCRILRARIPVLMEKPLGTTLAEAETLVQVAEQTGTPVMVGMNRRHDPVMHHTLTWLRSRDIRHAHALLHRQNRREDDFIEDAALHLVDLLCAVLGEGRVEELVPVGPRCGRALLLRLAFGDIPAQVQILPACGDWREEYSFGGDGFLVQAAPQQQVRISAPPSATEIFQRPAGPAGGWTTGETLAFLDALQGRSPWTPTPRDVLASMRLTLDIAARRRRL